MTKSLILAALALLASPLAAQTAPPAPAAPSAASQPGGQQMRPMRAYRGQMFGNVSPEGRVILRETMRGTAEERLAVRTARERINGLVAADQLDPKALKRAMEDERRLVDRNHAARQERLLAAIQKLSPADRKAFAEDARRGRDEIEGRMKRWRSDRGSAPGVDGAA